MVKLVLIRHGQSTANQTNTYTGWSDVTLTELGRQQAKNAGILLANQQIQFTAIHTSVLVRAISTANIVAEQIGQLWVPLYKTWRLNERHYGALRGLNKDETRKVYGSKQVASWRRSYFALPPQLVSFEGDRRYKNYPTSILPLAESLEMTEKRLLPYWQDVIAPELLKGNNQLIVAHGSSLRALIKYLEKIAPDDVDGLEVANAEPIIYDLDDKLRVLNKIIL